MALFLVVLCVAGRGSIKSALQGEWSVKRFDLVSPDQATYQIRVRGKLNKRWSDWFDGMTMAFESADDGTYTTTLTGTVADQARLRGILSQLWDSNLTVLCVTRVVTPKIDARKDKPERE
jgi:hypothetical protein